MSSPGMSSPGMSSPVEDQQRRTTAVELIREDQLVGLPLNGRSYSNLATLQTGVSDSSGANAQRGVGGGNLSVAGGRSTSNIYLMDGTNIQNAGNSAPRSAAGVQLGSDAVLQVQVYGTTYSAEYGRGSGGVLNSITRSGTDEFHGTLFEFFRNSKLDAQNFFDGGEKPPFKRNQFGGLISGPLVRGKTYIMGSYEAMRDRLTDTDISFAPTTEARTTGILRDCDFPGDVDEISIHPSMAPYLALYTPNNGAVRGCGVGETVGNGFQPVDEDFFVVRVDHQLTERDSSFLRYLLRRRQERLSRLPVRIPQSQRNTPAVPHAGNLAHLLAQRHQRLPVQLYPSRLAHPRRLRRAHSRQFEFCSRRRAVRAHSR